MWNLQSAKLITTLNGHTKEVESVAISSDGQTLASGSLDETIKLWNLHSTQEIRTQNCGYLGGVHCITFSPDGQTLGSGHKDGTVRFWNLNTGEELFRLRGHSVNGVNSIVFSPDGKILASCAFWDKTIQIWGLR